MSAPIGSSNKDPNNFKANAPAQTEKMTFIGRVKQFFYSIYANLFKKTMSEAELRKEGRELEPSRVNRDVNDKALAKKAGAAASSAFGEAVEDDNASVWEYEKEDIESGSGTEEFHPIGKNEKDNELFLKGAWTRVDDNDSIFSEIQSVHDLDEQSDTRSYTDDAGSIYSDEEMSDNASIRSDASYIYDGSDTGSVNSEDEMSDNESIRSEGSDYEPAVEWETEDDEFRPIGGDTNEPLLPDVDMEQVWKRDPWENASPKSGTDSSIKIGSHRPPDVLTPSPDSHPTSPYQKIPELRPDIKNAAPPPPRPAAPPPELDNS